MGADVTARHSILSDKEDRSLVSVFSAYVVCATLWLLFATGIGLLMAFKFGAPEFGAGAWLTFGRLRPIHTNATFYGFASIALIGLGYYVAARSSGTKLYSAALAWIGLVLFNVAAVAGTVALDLGYNDGDLEYREWLWWIRLIFLAAAGGDRVEPNRHGRTAQQWRHLPVQLVHHRRRAVDLHHRESWLSCRGISMGSVR